MALMPGIMSLFGRQEPATPASTPGVDPTQNTTIPTSQTPTSDGSVAAIPAVASGGPSSPLEKFADLWKADPNDTSKPVNLIPELNLDPARIMELSGKIKFTDHIPAETLQAAMSDPAQLKQVLEQVAQLGYANAVMSSGQVMRSSFGSAQNALKDSILPTAMRDNAISQALSSNPIFQDPAVAPMMGMLQNQLASKYPTAAPQEIAAMAAEYLQGMSQKVVVGSGGQILSREQQASARGPLVAKQEDWEKYFE